MRNAILAAGAVAIMALGGFAASADATVIGQTINTDLANTSFTLNFGNNNDASYTFGGGNFAFGSSRYDSPDTVMTDGSALVSSQGGGFFGKPLQPQAFSTVGVGLFVSSDLFPEYGPSAFDLAAPIPGSRGPGFLALKFQLSDGVHFGYAELTTNELISYGYQTDPGAGIQAGATSAVTTPAVPEPASWAMLVLGLGLIGWCAMIRRRAGAQMLTK